MAPVIKNTNQEDSVSSKTGFVLDPVKEKNMKIKKVMCLALAAAMIVAYGNVSTARADDFGEENVTLNVERIDQDADGIRNLVSGYFEERESILKDEGTGSFSTAVPAILTDETVHRTYLQDSNVVLVDSSVEITDVAPNDYGAKVLAEEYVVYAVDGETRTEVVEHEIDVYTTENGALVVASDAYCEDVSDFYSCSFVRESVQTLASNPGSKYCIIEVAEGEIGYEESGTNVTKYGSWYGLQDAWCAIFVSWCANQANVSTSVITKTASTATMRTFFNNKGTYYASSSQGGSYTPAVGDIFFQGTSSSNVNHVGIVVGVSSTSISVIDGNCEDKVNSHTISLTASNLVGFAKPAYASTSHTESSWQVDQTYHWRICVNCGYVTRRAAHSYSNGTCTVCNYTKMTTASQEDVID